MKSTKKLRLLSIFTALCLSFTAVFAEVEDDDSEEAIEKAQKQVTRLADKKSKYKDFIIYAEVSPVLKYIQKAKALHEDSKYKEALVHANLAWVYGTMAMDNAKSRFFQNAADKHFLKKYEKEIKAQQLKLALASAGLKKKGAVYSGTKPECDVFECKRRRWTEALSSKGTDMLKRIGGILKDNKKAKIRIEYGVRWDRKETKSSERVDILKKYLTDQLGVKGGQIEAKGVGRKLKKDAVKLTLSGVK